MHSEHLYAKLSYNLSKYIKLIDSEDGETQTTDAKMVCCID